MGLTGSNSGLFRVPGFIVSPVGKGERREDYRNYYKGHMDKIKGEGRSGEGKGFSWGGVEGWGEKAHNYN